ncbi:GPW/gp25 family protein [Dankookia sp. P2]|uniref:GPW/gp25 family protein n=1 Tax=Dankookia sp. P2 TaxID=3423955 RepID=UPI003D677CEC
MAAPRVAAWRFDGLSEAGAGRATGPVAALTGGIATVTGDAAIRQSILILLSTIPGERVMRPDYGCPLHRVVLSPNDATTAGLAIHYVRQALLRFEPRIEILHLDAGPAPEDAEAAEADGDSGTRLVIWLRYRVRLTRQTDTIGLAVDLLPGGA